LKSKLFRSARISRSATIRLNGPIRKVFPLFGALEEKKWADGWSPVILYPASAKLREGMVFTTPATNRSETVYTWIVSKHQPESNYVEYIVSTANRTWVIAIRCSEVSRTQTKAHVRYTYTGLNHRGNELNKRAIKEMFARNLRDWEEAMNHFLDTGKTLRNR
jgi:hypothetical protein